MNYIWVVEQIRYFLNVLFSHIVVCAFGPIEEIATIFNSDLHPAFDLIVRWSGTDSEMAIAMHRLIFRFSDFLESETKRIEGTTPNRGPVSESSVRGPAGCSVQPTRPDTRTKVKGE